jgi:hypothetical protein
MSHTSPNVPNRNRARCRCYTSRGTRPGRHDAGRTHKRHGTVDGTVTLGGRQVSVTRPRVRTADDTAEASLATYQAAKATDLSTGWVCQLEAAPL